MKRVLVLVLLLPGCGGEPASPPDVAPPPVVLAPPAPAVPRKGTAAPAEDEPMAELGDGTRLGPSEVACPPDRPFVCVEERAARCAPRPCPAPCDRTGCPSAFVCRDCGDGLACVPAETACPAP